MESDRRSSKRNQTLRDLPKVAALWLILFYQRRISPILPKSCRYQPTCSEYTLQAIKNEGVFRGILKGFLRIIRCNPLFKWGYDPYDPHSFGHWEWNPHLFQPKHSCIKIVKILQKEIK